MALLYVIGLEINSKSNWDEYSLNLFTEFLGFVLSVSVAVFIIDEMNKRRDNKQREEKELDDILFRIESPQPEIAQEAFRKLRKLNMLFGDESVLRGGIFFNEIRPVEVDLMYANLSDSIFFSDADFRFSDFSGANLENTFLRNARLTEAKLFGAMFKNADLQGADLSEAFLAGADFTGANLKHAKFVPPYNLNYISEQKEVEMFTLPDGNLYPLGSDFSRFTDPNHQDFWYEKTDTNSPAHPDYKTIPRILEQMTKNGIRRSGL